MLSKNSLYVDHSSNPSSQPNGRELPCSFTYVNNCDTSKHFCSHDQPASQTFQSCYGESSGFPFNSYTKPQQLLSTNCSINSKSSIVHLTDERNKTNFNTPFLELISTEKPIHKNSEQHNNTDVQSTTQPIISENSEIQDSILALESLLQVNSNLKNKDIATKPLSKPHTSERIVNRNSKWEVDEKRGAQATFGPVLYSNICLNLKETHPGSVITTVAIEMICFLY